MSEKKREKVWRSLNEINPNLNREVSVKKAKSFAEIEIAPGVDRRKFLGIMGASMALAGIATSGCIRRPIENIYPENKRPENTLPGVPKNYSTSALIGSGVLGLSVTSIDGRPTKIDGNSKHPMTNPLQNRKIGSSNSFAQAEILNLYDPLRGQQCLVGGKQLAKNEALQQIKNLVTLTKDKNGSGLAFLLEETASPAYHNLLLNLEKNYPNALIISQNTTYSSNRLAGLASITGKKVDIEYNLANAQTIIAVDSDFLSMEGDSVKNARQFAEKRRVLSSTDTMNRLYSIESNLSVTGANADHRFTLRSELMGNFLLALLKELNRNAISLPVGIETEFEPKIKLADNLTKWVKAVAKDLANQAGKSIVVVGDRQPAWVHTLGFAINYALGAVSTGLVKLTSKEKIQIEKNDIFDLVKAVSNNSIQTLIIVGGNPVYTQPADVGFSKLISQVKNSVYLAHTPDETSKLVNIYIPQTHFLESWGDTLSTDGTYAIRQPLIAPLYEECVNEYEFISNLIHDKTQTAYEIVKSCCQTTVLGKTNFELNWRQYLSDGVVFDAPKPEAITTGFHFEQLMLSINKYNPAANPTAQKLEIDFVLDRTVYDGRYANVSWMQELPDPIYKLVWDNAALISPKTAKELALNGNPKPGTSDVDVIKITYKNRSMEVAVWEVPGISDNTIVLPLGYGRQFGEVSKNCGFNANLIRTQGSWFGDNVTVEKTGKTYSLVSTQEHGSMNGTPGMEQDRTPVVRQASYENFKKNPNFVLNYELINPEEQKSLLFNYPKNPDQSKWARQQWGMSIDLTTCIGCNACTVACQSENNISVVGKEEVFKNREMHWIRIDRYFTGLVDSPDVQAVFQPMPCQHCENAPCEAVCPVNATVHSPDGLNDMAYNRCVGTRYCANNCPYKVRRYNFFNYSKIDDERNPLYAMQKNPNVTVRFRGVMEKCSFCVHRINAAKVKANTTSSDGLVPDGAMTTACQDACPTNSIIFGDIADPKSMISKIKSSPRNYSLLGELNTRPRTTYLAKLRNINPEI